MNRRHFLAGTSTGFVMLGAPALFAQQGGRLKQSVARWCFAGIPIEEFCIALRDMGVTGMDLVGPADWEICKRYGITPALVAGAGSFASVAQDGNTRRYGKAIGWNKVANHAQLLTTARTNIELAGAAGINTIIGLFGDREGMSDEEGITNCVTGLKQIVPMLEKHQVTLGIEVLNSLVDHPDYQGDNTAYGVEVCKRLGSPFVKLVYDAYHMQIMEGNLISTLRANIDYICHIHIAGVPGRNEPDERQEVNWRRVAQAIADLNFQGYVAHEWIPTGSDPLADLRKAVEMMNV